MLPRGRETCNSCNFIVDNYSRTMKDLPPEVRRAKVERFVENVRDACNSNFVCLPYVRLKDKSVSDEKAVVVKEDSHEELTRRVLALKDSLFIRRK